ncbi:porin [Ampullimonas aquatilis]|uniref:porin n=1 Tax=Ampullimonas aquatilis TaxID=1341549 RepID=UPI003C711879
MNKKIITLALLSMLPVLASAESNVTLYGLVDGGFLTRGNESGAYKQVAGANFNGRKNEMASGIESDSRFGLRGTEDLGNGLTALFQLEAGFALDDGKSTLNDSQSNGIFRRNSYVGLTSASGTGVIGRIDGGRYSIAGKYDPFANGTVANMASVQVHGTRADNAIAYISPVWSGFSFLAAFTPNLIGQEHPGNVGDGRLWAIIPSYTNGPLNVTVDYERLTPKGAEKYKTHIYVAAASYDLGYIKLHSYFEKIKTDNYSDLFKGTLGTYNALFDHNSWMIGASAPIDDRTKVRASYVKYDDKTSLDASCNKYGIGAVYTLSKRTHIYTDYARISNRSNGICSIAPSPVSTAVDSGGTGSPAGGYGVSGFDFGISHSF